MILTVLCLFFDRDVTSAEDHLSSFSLKVGYSSTDKEIHYWLGSTVKLTQTDTLYFGQVIYISPLSFNDYQGAMAYFGFTFGITFLDDIHAGLLLGAIGGGAMNSSKSFTGGANFVIEPGISYQYDLSTSTKIGFSLSYLYVPILSPSDTFFKNTSQTCFAIDLYMPI